MSKHVDGGLFQSPPCTIVIGIDQSYTGFAMTALAETGDFFTWLRAFPASLYHGSRELRLRAIYNFLAAALADINSEGYTVVKLGMEGYAFGAKYFAHSAGELGATILLSLGSIWQLGTDSPAHPYVAPPTALKKYVTGDGRASKSQIIAHVYKRWGVMFDGDDEADSYGLARMLLALAQWDDGQEPPTAYERDALLRLKASRHSAFSEEFSEAA